MRKTISKAAQSQHRLLKNQLSSLILNGKIVTTQAKAKNLKAKAQNLFAAINKYSEDFALRRYLAKELYGGSAKKVFDLKGQFQSVSTYKLDKRFGDGAPQVLVAVNMKELENKPNPTDTKSAKRKAAK